MTQRTIDAYLTKRAQRTWPRAQVWRSEDRCGCPTCLMGEVETRKVLRTYTVRRRLHDWVRLGETFGAARAALDALAASERAEVAT